MYANLCRYVTSLAIGGDDVTHPARSPRVQLLAQSADEQRANIRPRRHDAKTQFIII